MDVNLLRLFISVSVDIIIFEYKDALRRVTISSLIPVRVSPALSQGFGDAHENILQTWI